MAKNAEQNNDAAEQQKCNLLISLTPELRQKYKTWCSSHGITMNAGVTSFMETVTARKRTYKLQTRILELAK